MASLLHDLGKLAIPEAILAKPSELDEPEWRVIAEHPKIGQVVLEQAGALRDAATIVLHHHEWFDGRGYPHGLSGEDIPIGARIVAIADAYEAMVAGRPYRSSITHSEAIAELRRHGGIQFDPELVEPSPTCSPRPCPSRSRPTTASSASVTTTRIRRWCRRWTSAPTARSTTSSTTGVGGSPTRRRATRPSGKVG